MQRSVHRRGWPKRGTNGAVKEKNHLIILTQLGRVISSQILAYLPNNFLDILQDSWPFRNPPLLWHNVSLNLYPTTSDFG